MKITPPLEEWVVEECPKLASDIRNHLQEYCPDISQQDHEDLIRVILISIRSRFDA